jgi:hypothetical protein
MQIKTNTARVGIKHQSVKLNQIKTFPNKQVCMSVTFFMMIVQMYWYVDNIVLWLM